MSDYVGQQLGGYNLTKKLGSGGFADVYLGEHIYLHNKNAAIKVLKGMFSKQDIEKFLEEAQIIHRLQHPHIVQIADFNVAILNGQSIPFLVMDYAPYGSVRARHRRGMELPLETIISYVKPIAMALQYAHDQKVIHRDIKPANLLIGKHKDILLSDFGNAVVAHSTQSMLPQDTTGTWPYMAPEQFMGKPRPASDQYALGIVVYEWLCGETPFSGPSFDLYAYQHQNAAPPTLDKRAFPALECVVLQALAKDPKKRFPNIQAFAEALEQACLRGVVTILEDPQYAKAFLAQEGIRRFLLNQILENADWWNEKGKASLVILREQSTKDASLTEALTLLADSIASALVAIMEEGHTISTTELNRVKVHSMTLLSAMSCLAPAGSSAEVWVAFLHTIVSNEKVLDFITTHWDIHAYLLKVYSQISSPAMGNSELIRPLLRLKWTELGAFLSLDAHKAWYNIVIAALLSTASAELTPAIVQDLEQIYTPQVEDLFKELHSNVQQWPIAKSLFTVLISSNYTKKMRLLSIMLNVSMETKSIQEVLEAARLTNEESATSLSTMVNYILLLLRCFRY